MTALAQRLTALDEVLAIGSGRLDPVAIAAAERVAGKATDRLRLGEHHTVVALAGATGSGKSSLFNALAGADLSQVGLRRPTTGTAHAAVWGSDAAVPLLDWLDVRRRHLVTGDPDLAGLVLLDLPDVDSIQRAHRVEASRLADRVDLLVWVLDPQKYADAALHEDFLVPLAGHAGVMLVVLNQADRLAPPAREACLADLRELLAAEGLGGVPVTSASARTGEGLGSLRSELARRVSAHRSAVRRLEADLGVVAASLGDVCGPKPAGIGKSSREALTAALADAAGADVVASAVAASHRLRARRATGWPFTRWLGRFRLDPAARLRLRSAPSELVRTSLPGPSPVQRSRVDSALRDLSGRAAEGLPDPWPAAVRSASLSSREFLPDLLDRAVAGAELGVGRRPRWWGAVRVVQALFAAAAVVGLLWLLVLFGLAWLKLPDPPLPRVGILPLPTLLLGAGLLAGLLLALLSRTFAGIGARRLAAKARRRIRERVRTVADEHVAAPVERELTAYADLCAAIARL
ncbi:MAG: hypothetical protein QOJ50_1427 [Cryptosporangiaceae bacterium]|nr:hypothetical protein [Cryptosporangiaceae bacterium]